MTLKPQDVVVAIKLCKYSANCRPSFARIGADLKMSASETHAAVQRVRAARLIGPAELDNRPNLSALEEFLIHGVKYAFYVERGEPTRGIPTSYAAPPLDRLIVQNDELPPVWPHPEGKTRGVSFEPLYRTVPSAAMGDPFLYECLALVDALRDGRVREKKIAERELRQRLRGKWVASTIGAY